MSIWQTRNSALSLLATWCDQGQRKAKKRIARRLGMRATLPWAQRRIEAAALRVMGRRWAHHKQKLDAAFEEAKLAYVARLAR